MAIPSSVPKTTRGNRNWGRPVSALPAPPTQFELLVHQLKLGPEMYTSSWELRIWCQRNRNHLYVPGMAAEGVGHDGRRN